MDSAEQNGRLDVWLPVSHWTTRHDRRVAAPPAEVARALREVTPGEMRLARPLVAVRTLPSRLAGKGRQQPTGPPDAVHDMMRAGFIRLDGEAESDQPDGAVILGFVGQPWKPVLSKAIVRDVTPEEFRAFDRPGYLKGLYAMWVEPDGAGSRLLTETRVFVTSESAARRFKPYWALIEPFSGLIRRDWLRAVGRRVECPA
ncbi:hypothetical protein [Streptomyces sp. NPDC058045]|uniref:hypothetical protein n=1 Tax=Streptomyces sp. NPDC058045 TaxID=3346311 RepID=UPI0036E43346